MNNSETLFRFNSPNGDNYVIFEDDMRVAFIYFLNGDGSIVSDCWLYNRQPTPATISDAAGRGLPPLNSQNYTVENHAHWAVTSVADIKVNWVGEQNNIAEVYLFDELFAVISAGNKLGACILAKKDGPLARSL